MQHLRRRGDQCQTGFFHRFIIDQDALGVVITVVAGGQRARLSLMGVEARVTEREQAGRTVYRVRVGPFQNKDAADRVKDRLDGDGFDSALVRVQR